MPSQQQSSFLCARFASTFYIFFPIPKAWLLQRTSRLLNILPKRLQRDHGSREISTLHFAKLVFFKCLFMVSVSVMEIKSRGKSSQANNNFVFITISRVINWTLFVLRNYKSCAIDSRLASITWNLLLFLPFWVKVKTNVAIQISCSNSEAKLMMCLCMVNVLCVHASVIEARNPSRSDW